MLDGDRLLGQGRAWAVLNWHSSAPPAQWHQWALGCKLLDRAGFVGYGHTPALIQR